MLEYGRLYTDETSPGSNDFVGDAYVSLLALATGSNTHTMFVGLLNHFGLKYRVNICQHAECKNLLPVMLESEGIAER